MRVQAERMREWMRTSFAVAPTIATLVALLAAKALTHVDRGISQNKQSWWLFGGDAANAIQLLSTVASSLMQFTAVVFSISILVLQLASSQFSPRVLRTFLEDKQTQWTMGFFIGNFVYAMSLLPELRVAAAGQREFVPALSISIAFLLTILSVLIFASYIQNMAQAIRAVHVIHRVATETRHTIAQLYPTAAAANTKALELPQGKTSRRLLHDSPPGVVMHVREQALVEVARKHGVVIELVPRVGDFVPRGAPLFTLWGDAPLTVADLGDHVVIGLERTPHQDPAFGFRQLVDVAERALSPAINDPTTAVQAIDQLHDLLRSLASRPFPSAFRSDDEGHLRLIVRPSTWNDFVHLAVDEIRQYGQGSLQVVRRIKAMLEDLLTCVPPERQPVLQQQLVLVNACVEERFKGTDQRQAAAPSSAGNG